MVLRSWGVEEIRTILLRLNAKSTLPSIVENRRDCDHQLCRTGAATVGGTQLLGVAVTVAHADRAQAVLFGGDDTRLTAL